VAEGMMASTILAIAVVGIAGPLSAAHEHSRVIEEQSSALLLARQLMEEISAKPLWDGGTSCNLGPEAGAGETSRGKFDSVDDYHNYGDDTDSFKDLSGSSVSLKVDGKYTRAVKVEYRTTPTGAATTSGEFALVTVTVTTPHNVAVKLSRLFSKQSLTF
jgi:hypothetical protein